MENNTSYKAIRLYENFWRIDEGGVRMFLIIGDEYALLIDTGFGTGDLKTFVGTLTDKPVHVLNTHADGDHTGCNAQFDAVEMHEDELGSYAAKGGDCSKVRKLCEGDRIVLGGYSFEILHMPGHTPGSIMLLDAQHRLLLSGDSVQTGSIYMFGPGRDLNRYIDSLIRLQSLSDSFDTVLPSHGPLPVSADILPSLLQGAKDLRDGKLCADPPPREGMPCKSYDCGAAKFLY